MGARRGVAAALVAATMAAASSPARAEECAPKPSSPTGYQVTAVGADRVTPPATTPPIAVLDSGVSAVPELQGRLRAGVNVVSGGSNVDDTDGHGTAVASIAAAAAGGVQGISPTSPVIPVKILDARGETSAADVVAGIDAAVHAGAKVINLSAAAPAGPITADDRKVMIAIDRAVARGVLVVAPSGNEGTTRLDIPATYPHVLAVGATDESGVAADFSNRGPGLDLVAPGADIYAAAPAAVCSTGYAFLSGTSLSVPVVAGAAALVAAARPGLDASQLTDLLRFAGGSPAWSASLGFGMLNVPAVLGAPLPTAQPREVDDDVYWVKRSRFVLSSAWSATVTGVVAPHTDPADVYRVKLAKGDRFGASASGSRLTLGLWDASTGAFDVTSGKTAHRLATGPDLRRIRIKRAGVYYVSVAPARGEAAGAAYTLKLTR